MTYTLRIALVLVAIELALGCIRGYLAAPFYPYTWGAIAVIVALAWLAETL